VTVCENDKTDSRPLERKRSVSFDKLITSIAAGIRDEDNLTSLAGRLAKMEREIDEKDRRDIKKAAEGKSLKVLINSLLDAVDPDKKFEKAREIFKTETPTYEQIRNAGKELAKIACIPFDSSKLRNLLSDIKKRNEQDIDITSIDTVIFSGFDEQAKIKARTLVDTFKKFIEENKDEITALQIIYSKPYSKRHLTYEEIREVADAIRKPPYQLTPEILWQAYEQLDKSKVKGAGVQKLLTNIVSLIRFASGKSDVLEPYPETVNQRFEKWKLNQEISGVRFTEAQMGWLLMIKDHIATSLSIGNEDFELSPFYEKGGAVKAYQLFGNGLNNILEQLNEVLAV
jgi:type I restriction enzyme R subunit